MTFFNQVLEFINEHTWLSVIVFVITSVVTLTLLLDLFEFISSINKLLDEKIIKYRIKRTDHLNMVTMQLPERIDLTNSIFDLIDSMIEDEILSFMKDRIALREKYNVLNLDTDVGEISTNIYNAFNKDLFTDPNLLLNKEYMMSYITKKTSYALLVNTLTHNENLKKLTNDTE